MTPLASYLAKQLASRPKHREHIWAEEENAKRLRRELYDVHCFEVSQCAPLVGELSHAGVDRFDQVCGTFAFLPAPKTWVEWIHPSGRRIAVLCQETKGRIKEWGDRRIASCTFFCEELAEHLGYLSLTSGDYYDGHPDCLDPRHLPTYVTNIIPGGARFSGPALLSYCQVCLVMINSPQIIGRSQHMPNRGLERNLTRSFGAGSFPLLAWTELKLRVNKPVEIDDGEAHEAHLTGRRALHFVRKHIRIRDGRLGYVSAHWRGDPAIGIKQTRYTVTP